jgi:hypothetical protein
MHFAHLRDTEYLHFPEADNGRRLVGVNSGISSMTIGTVRFGGAFRLVTRHEQSLVWQLARRCVRLPPYRFFRTGVHTFANASI